MQGGALGVVFIGGEGKEVREGRRVRPTAGKAAGEHGDSAAGETSSASHGSVKRVLTTSDRTQ